MKHQKPQIFLSVMNHSLQKAQKIFLSQNSENELLNHKNMESFTVSLSNVKPIPVELFVSGQWKRKPRKRQGTTVSNSIPNLEETKEKINKKYAVSKRRRVTGTWEFFCNLIRRRIHFLKTKMIIYVFTAYTSTKCQRMRK